MRKIYDFLGADKKLGVIILYFLISLVVFQKRETTLYRFVPVLRTTLLGDWPLNLLLGSLILLGLVSLVNLLYRPWFIVNRINLALERADFQNGTNEIPEFYCIKRDKDREHGLIIKVKNKGFSEFDFNSKVPRLQTSLGGKIYCIEPDKRTGITNLYFLRNKYAHLSILSPQDDAIGETSLKDLINLLVIGATGTGKTVTIKIIMQKIAKFQPDAKMWPLDYKQFDFREFSGMPHYYGYTDCFQGLKDYYAAFKARQKTGVAGDPNYLIIDEWGAFISSLDKKSADQAKNMLAEILMLGRAYKFIPIIGIQRPDASYFNGGRDNIQACLALGNLSPEGRRMVFPDSVKEQITNCKKREGHLFIDGIGLEKIRIEDIADMDALDRPIREAMSR